MSIRVQIMIEIPGDEISLDRQPRWVMADNPADVADRELDRALADAKTWLATRTAREASQP